MFTATILRITSKAIVVLQYGLAVVIVNLMDHIVNIIEQVSKRVSIACLNWKPTLSKFQHCKKLLRVNLWLNVFQENSPYPCHIQILCKL